MRKNGNPRAFPIFIFKWLIDIEIKSKPETYLFFAFIVISILSAPTASQNIGIGYAYGLDR